MISQLSGLAKVIRETVASARFDLEGYTEEKVKELITNTFAESFTAPTELIKLTFVVGGGKLGHMLYSNDLPTWSWLH